MKNEVTEEIITASETEEETVKRVDKRPASVFSIFVFAMLFVIGYLLYPQLTMLLPFPGTAYSISTSYQPATVDEMLYVDTIVIATVKDEGKTISKTNQQGQPLVYRNVTFSVDEVIKGNQSSEFSLPEYGGKALFSVNGKKKKYNVTYQNSAQFEKNKKYILFISDGDVVNGKAGAMEINEDGSFTDIRDQSYSIDYVKVALKEGVK